MPAPSLDQDTVRRLLFYDPGTGVFTWHVREDVRPQWNGRYAGKVAGYDWQACPNVTYRCIRIFDWPFLAHRLAFLYVNGEWPPDGVDHIDGDGLNNRWNNLRLATKVQNAGNVGLLQSNTTGFKGVSRCKHTKKFRATIKVDGRQKWLGYHDTPEQAHAAYCAAARKKYGQFARTK